METKDYSLIFVLNDDNVLLGMKKRGFGEGKLNGFGGKWDAEDKTIEDCVVRELQEESGLVVDKKNLCRHGYIVFNMKNSKKIMNVHVYSVCEDQCAGELVETDEMRPLWVDRKALPFAQMWPDDKYWLHNVMEGRKFIARFDYEDDNTIVDYSVDIVGN